MGRIKSIEWVFYCLIIFFIATSIFFSIPIGEGEIGISSDSLAIGDRTFYIDDLDPFGMKGYQNYKGTGISFSGGILYPKILEIASFISEKIFNQSTTSTLWNTIVIIFASICSVLTHKLLYLIGKLIGGEKTGNMCMIIYTICPYTYYYVLGGGITNYTLLFCSLSTYSLVKIINLQNFQSFFRFKNELAFLSFSLLSLSLLRPSSAIFSLVICFGILIQICLQQNNIAPKGGSLNSLKNILILISVSISVISINELFKTRDYSVAAINASLDYGGSFFGYSRELLREKIFSLTTNNNLVDFLKSFIYKLIFMVTDFYAGINDVRDSFAASQQVSIVPFLARVFIGVFFFMPFSTLSIVGIITFRKKIIETGFIIPLFAAFVAISTSFFGCSLSRYYFMFITPFIVSSSLLLDAVRSLSKKVN